MSEARDVIARANSGAPFPSARSMLKADCIISALTAAGYRIIGPGEPAAWLYEFEDGSTEQYSAVFGIVGYRNGVKAISRTPLYLGEPEAIRALSEKPKP